MIYGHNDHKVTLIDVPAGRRTLLAHASIYYVAVPRTVLIVSTRHIHTYTGGLHAFFADDGPALDEDTTLYMPFLPNCDSDDGNVCLGGEITANTHEKAVQRTVDAFYTRRFETSGFTRPVYVRNTPGLPGREIRFFSDWATATKDDPNLSIIFQQVRGQQARHTTVRQFLKDEFFEIPQRLDP